jgi:hypothetical protein
MDNTAAALPGKLVKRSDAQGVSTRHRRSLQNVSTLLSLEVLAQIFGGKHIQNR